MSVNPGFKATLSAVAANLLRTVAQADSAPKDGLVSDQELGSAAKKGGWVAQQRALLFSASAAASPDGRGIPSVKGIQSAITSAKDTLVAAAGSDGFLSAAELHSVRGAVAQKLGAYAKAVSEAAAAPTDRKLSRAFAKVLTSAPGDRTYVKNLSSLKGEFRAAYAADKRAFAGDADRPQLFTVTGQQYLGYFVDDGQTSKTVIANLAGKILVNKQEGGD